MTQRKSHAMQQRELNAIACNAMASDDAAAITARVRSSWRTCATTRALAFDDIDEARAMERIIDDESLSEAAVFDVVMRDDDGAAMRTLIVGTFDEVRRLIEG